MQQALRNVEVDNKASQLFNHFDDDRSSLNPHQGMVDDWGVGRAGTHDSKHLRNFQCDSGSLCASARSAALSFFNRCSLCANSFCLLPTCFNHDVGAAPLASGTADDLPRIQGGHHDEGHVPRCRRCRLSLSISSA